MRKTKAPRLATRGLTETVHRCAADSRENSHSILISQAFVRRWLARRNHVWPQCAGLVAELAQIGGAR